jgi:hypothetical protein
MVHNIADITPNSVATALKAARTPCNWVIISAPAANSGVMRVGDSTTGASSGAIIAKGESLTLFPIGDTQYLDLSLVFVYGASSDVVGVLYGTH